MRGARNTCRKCMHTLRKKCICTRACASMQRCRSYFAMKAIANLSWILRDIIQAVVCHPPSCQLDESVAWRCSLKKSVQIHASSWRGRRGGVAQASFDHPRWCGPHPVCLWFTLADLIQFVYGSHSPRTSLSTKFYLCHGFCGLSYVCLYNHKHLTGRRGQKIGNMQSRFYYTSPWYLLCVCVCVCVLVGRCVRSWPTPCTVMISLARLQANASFSMCPGWRILLIFPSFPMATTPTGSSPKTSPVSTSCGTQSVRHSQ